MVIPVQSSDLVGNSSTGQNLIDLANETKDKLNESIDRINNSLVVSVKDFPFLAVGDGVTDDTAAIQAALAHTISVEGELYIPPGNYVISASLNIYGNISVKGAGPQVSVIQPTTAVDEPIQIGNVVSANDAH